MERGMEDARGDGERDACDRVLLCFLALLRMFTGRGLCASFALKAGMSVEYLSRREVNEKENKYSMSDKHALAST